MLINKELDFAIGLIPIEDELIDWELIHTDNFLISLPKHHPFAKEREIPLINLRNETFIISNQHEDYKTQLFQICQRAGFLPSFREANNYESVIDLAENGCGIFLIVEPLYDYYRNQDKAWVEHRAYIKISEPQCNATVGVNKLRSGTMSTPVMEFYEYIVHGLKERFSKSVMYGYFA